MILVLLSSYAVRSHFLVLYCTLLAQAQSSDEKAQIEGEMAADPDLADILKQLQGDDNDPAEVSQTEARSKGKGLAEALDNAESARVGLAR